MDGEYYDVWGLFPRVAAWWENLGYFSIDNKIIFITGKKRIILRFSQIIGLCYHIIRYNEYVLPMRLPQMKE